VIKWIGKHIFQLKSEFREDVEVKKKVIDSSGSAGESGYVLTTDGLETLWKNPRGESGASSTINLSSTYTHTQSSASTTWTVNHNLDRRPSVTIVTSTEAVVIGDVFYNNDNQLTITISHANSGKAYLN
tara:strand:+ start:448 stop:834 length:387 start_codon:yes stop_codon:yes gene_type:complete